VGFQTVPSEINQRVRHKYGLVYPGLGWLIFRDTTDLPDDLVFYVNYLGDEMPSYTLNFSRGSGMLLAQYYNLLRLGWEGYAMAAKAVLEHAQYLTKRLLDTGYFDILNGAEILPVVTFQLKEPLDFSVYDLSAKLRNEVGLSPRTRCHQMPTQSLLCASSSDRTSVAIWQISSLTTLKRRTPLCWRQKPRQL